MAHQDRRRKASIAPVEKNALSPYAFRMNVVLMAGGGGTRLWPLSRRHIPKQFLDLGRGRTLIEEAYGRAQQLTAPDRIYVATGAAYRQHVSRLLPDIPPERLFFEPQKRDTTAAFAAVAIRLQQRGEGETPTLFMWADHVFTNEDAFLTGLHTIPALLQRYPDHIVIVGHHPVTPDTTLGYIEAGEQVPQFKNTSRVVAFREKPDQLTAEQYVSSGRHFWNLGYFSVRPNYLLQELLRLNPDLQPAVSAFARAIEQQDEAGADRAYGAFPMRAIEYTLIERTPRLLLVAGDYGWSDVGNWAAVKKIFGGAGDHVRSGHHLHLNCQDNYIYNTTDKTVTIIGLCGVIAVITDDAILLTDQEHAPLVKEAVQRLEKDKKTDVL